MPRLGSDETAKTPLPGRKAAEERGEPRLEMYPRLGGRGWGRQMCSFPLKRWRGGAEGGREDALLWGTLERKVSSSRSLRCFLYGVDKGMKREQEGGEGSRCTASRCLSLKLPFSTIF